MHDGGPRGQVVDGQVLVKPLRQLVKLLVGARLALLVLLAPALEVAPHIVVWQVQLRYECV